MSAGSLLDHLVRPREHSRRNREAEGLAVFESVTYCAVLTPDYHPLLAEVSLGRAGAVISLEVSRLARNNRDWHQLLELCGLTNTIIVDAEGIYDPL
jgi:DNA invertase Pin-like site-specific DNA recombinase